MDKKTSLISKKIASLRGGIQAAATLITIYIFLICLREKYIREMQKQYVCRD